MPPPIPQFSLERQHRGLEAELGAAWARVAASGRYAQGPECAALETEIAAWMGAAGAPTQGEARLRAVVCSSGTDALHLALRAAGVAAGDVVLTTPFTFFATAGAILLAGARPESVDISPSSFNLDPAALEAALARHRSAPGPAARLGAILPVHLYGRLAGMEAIGALAAAAGVPVIEDAAQALGAHRGGRPAGAWGAAAAFSFYPTKNLGALGEGGMVTTTDAGIEERLRLLRVHGSRRRYEHELAGWNGRMHELQAAALRAKLPHLDAWNRRRREIALLYRHHLNGVVEQLPEIEPGHVFHQYVIRVPNRDAVRQKLLQRGIGAEVYYPIPLHRQPALRDFAPAAPLPEAERAAAEVLALPMFPELTDAEAARVAGALRECLA